MSFSYRRTSVSRGTSQSFQTSWPLNSTQSKGPLCVNISSGISLFYIQEVLVFLVTRAIHADPLDPNRETNIDQSKIKCFYLLIDSCSRKRVAG